MFCKRLLVVLVCFCQMAIYNPAFSQQNGKRDHFSNQKNAAYYNSRYNEYFQISPDTAFYYASIALKKAIEENNIEEQGKAYLNIAGYYYSIQDTLSIAYSKKAIEAFKKTSNLDGLAQAYVMLAENHFNFGNTKNAYENYNLALTCYEKQGDVNSYTITLSSIGHIYMQWGEYTKALNCFQKLLSIHEAMDNKIEIAEDYNSLGELFIRYKKYDESIIYYTKALKIYEIHNDHQNISKVMKYIGRTYRFIGDNSKALSYYHKALKELNDTNTIEASLIYEEIGNTYYFQDKINEAIDYYNKTYSIRSSLDTNNQYNLVALSHSISNLGKGYHYKKNYALAIEYYQKALKIEKDHNHLFSVAEYYILIANSYKSWRKYNKALEYYDMSLQISKKLNYKTYILENYISISETYKTIKDYEQSLKYYTRYIALKDSIFSEESHKQLTELQAKYEIDKKEKEIQILSKDKEIKEIALKKEEETVKTQRLSLLILIVGSALVVAFLIVLLRLYKHKKEANHILEAQKEEITTQRDDIERKNEILKDAYNIIEQKNKKITSSIKYAQRIQQAILPSNDVIERLIPDSFVLFIPKDIVSGDFYWLDQKTEDKIYFAAVDCTGHGVPGAFMSIHAYNLLDKAIKDQNISKPSEILHYLSDHIHMTLQQRDEQSSVKDSMDIALCCFDKQTRVLEYAGAGQPLLIVNQSGLTEFKSDRHPVGIDYNNANFTYKNHVVNLGNDDVIYIFTDGYTDQFGGSKKQKYLLKELKKTLQEIMALPLMRQKEILRDTFDKWKGNNEQVDDVLVMGIRL